MAVEPEARRRAHEWLEEVYSKLEEREALFETISGQPVKPLYTEEDRAGADPERDLGYPGEYPYTRGVYPSMYRGRLWTMRQFAGFGTAEETNERFHYLLDHGQTGLSTAFDMPTLMGSTPTPTLSSARSGWRASRSTPSTTWRRSSRASTWASVTTSMTINAPAAILLAFYVATAEEQGVPPERLGGTIQTDILKEYIAQKEWCFPIEPAMRLVEDMIEWCTEHMPRWHPISISGLPHPRGRLDRPAGARLHAQGRPHLRRAGDRARPRRRRLRPAALVLLQRPHRLLRGDRQVPRGAPDLGAGDARDLRRQARGVAGGCASTPRPPASR